MTTKKEEITTKTVKPQVPMVNTINKVQSFNKSIDITSDKLNFINSKESNLDPFGFSSSNNLSSMSFNNNEKKSNIDIFSSKNDNVDLFPPTKTLSNEVKGSSTNIDFDFGFKTKDDKLSDILSQMNSGKPQNNSNTNNFMFENNNSTNQNPYLIGNSGYGNGQNLNQIGGFSNYNNFGYPNIQGLNNTGFGGPNINIHQPNINVSNTYYNSYTLEPKEKIKLNYGKIDSNKNLEVDAPSNNKLDYGYFNLGTSVNTITSKPVSNTKKDPFADLVKFN